MAAVMAEIALHTVKSTYTGPFSRQTPRLFDRVIGISATSRSAWLPRELLPYHNCRADATEQVIDLPPEFNAALLAFFETFLSDRRMGFGAASFNCHTFADAMTAKPPRSSLVTDLRAGHLLRSASPADTDTPLMVGQRGMIGKKTSFNRLKPLHSLIGIGAQDPRCLHVTNLWGSLALSPYAHVFEYYEFDMGHSRFFTCPPKHKHQ